MRILASLTLTLIAFIAFAHHVTSPVLQAADSAVSILHLKDGQYLPYCSGAVVRLPQVKLDGVMISHLPPEYRED